MSTRRVRFFGLSDQDRGKTAPLPELVEGDRMELRVLHKDGREQVLPLPATAASLVETLVSRLLTGKRVAVVVEGSELSPAEASTLLGISRPLVLHRMDIGDLPFRHVGKHRRALLKDVLALKARLDIQQKAMEALAEDAEDLTANHRL